MHVENTKKHLVASVGVFKIKLLNLVPNFLFNCHIWTIIGTYFWGFESLIGLYKDPMCLWTLCEHSVDPDVKGCKGVGETLKSTDVRLRG